MFYFWVFVISKRLILEWDTQLARIGYHMLIIGFFYLLMYFYSMHPLCTQYVPYLLAVLSYFTHSRFTWQELRNPPEDGQEVMLSPNTLIKSQVLFGGLVVNHIYLDTFLSLSFRDSLSLNFITWGLLI